MPKRISTNWFKLKSQQQTVTNMSQLRTIAQTGPRPEGAGRARQEDEAGRSFFVVGKSEIGGEEVI